MKAKKRIDLSGQVFGRLTAIEIDRVTPEYKVYWRCRCVCGRETIAHSVDLRNGDTKSCGCLRWSGDANRSHGQSRTPLYASWNAMIARCENPRNRAFKNYGGRGIKVCRRWRNSFELFMKDVGPRPSKRHTLERKNNDDDYRPGNVVWATYKTQNNNRRDNVRLTFDGETLTVAQWTRRLGLPEFLLYDRLRKGWSADRALTTPVKR